MIFKYTIKWSTENEKILVTTKAFAQPMTCPLTLPLK